jgi:hypothetical protein
LQQDAGRDAVPGVAKGEPGDLLDEGFPPAAGCVAEEPAHRELDRGDPAADRRVV